MPTTNFKIGSGASQFDFTLEIDFDGNLVSIGATKDGCEYDCLLQMQPHDESRGIECCRPSGCTSGTCSQ